MNRMLSTLIRWVVTAVADVLWAVGWTAHKIVRLAAWIAAAVAIGWEDAS